MISKSSRSIRGTQRPDFEVLDAKIASVLNRIIHNSHFKRRVSLEEQKAQKEDRFLRGTQIAYFIYEYSGSQEPTILSRIMPTYSLLVFEMTIFRNSIRNGTIFFVSMTQIPSDDILESLCKLRIRESEKLKTVLELYNMGIHQKKPGPDYHRLKTMVKRSIEQNLRMKNFEDRNGNYDTNAVIKNPRMKQREQRRLGDCWQWEANGYFFETRQLQFPSRHE